MCPQRHPCLSAFEFINNRNCVFSVSSFASHFPTLDFFLLPTPPFHPAAFHVTAISRWTTPRTPNAKSGTEPYFELFTQFFRYSLTPLRICDANTATVLIALLFSQPPGGIPGSQPLLPNSLDPTRPQGKAGKTVVVTGQSCVDSFCIVNEKSVTSYSCGFF